jgi:hypothetical protein
VPTPTISAPAIAPPANAPATRRQPFCDVIDPPVQWSPRA